MPTRTIRRAATTLRELFPGVEGQGVSPLAGDYDTATAFTFPHTNGLVQVLRGRVLRKSRRWPFAHLPDPSKSGLPSQDWGRYMSDDAEVVDGAPFPMGIGVIWDTPGGADMYLAVLMARYLVRQIEPRLDPAIEAYPLWLANVPELREEGAAAYAPVRMLAETACSYAAKHGQPEVHIAVNPGKGPAWCKTIQCNGDVKHSYLAYGDHMVDVVVLRK